MSILFYTGNGESQNVCADDINLDQCTNSAGHGYVEILAADNNRFINEFVVVYAKMIDKVKYLLSQIRKSLQDNLMLCKVIRASKHVQPVTSKARQQ